MLRACRPVQLGDARAGVQVLVPGQGEEAAVGVEGGLEELVQELAKEAAAVDTCLVQALGVDELDPHLEPHVGLWNVEKEKSAFLFLQLRLTNRNS